MDSSWYPLYGSGSPQSFSQSQVTVGPNFHSLSPPYSTSFLLSFSTNTGILFKKKKMGRGQQKSYYLLETDSEIFADEITCYRQMASE